MQNIDLDLEYAFANFNKKIELVSYTDEEYEHFLKDADWTKTETDYLFDLCRTFDLRFFVIADRYAFEKARSIEVESLEIKLHILFTVFRKLRIDTLKYLK